MELVNRFKTCQAGRKVTERNITYLYIKWHGEGEVGALSSKARTRWHQIKLLSVRLKPKEMFYIRLKQKKCFVSCTQLSCRMPCPRLWWLLKAYVGSKSKWTWKDKFRQYLSKWRLDEYSEEVALCACSFLLSYLCTCHFSLPRK